MQQRAGVHLKGGVGHAILGDHRRAAKDKRYPVPMGQETFTHPSRARALLDADWKDHWIPKHLSEVKPPPARKAKP